MIITDMQAKIERALELIADGSSVRRATAEAGLQRNAFLREVDGDAYARARDAQADTHFHDMADLEAQCLSGKLDYNAFRAAMDARKWRLARMKPKAYGDKMAVEHTGLDLAAILTEARARAAS